MGNPIWADPNYLKLWIYCLFQASYKEHEQLVGNQMVKLERGQFITGRFALAEEMNRGVKPKQRINELTWWRHLSNLEKFGMLNIKTTNKYSIITVENYDFYQGMVSKDEQQSEQQLNNKRTTDEQQLNTNNKENKENKDNKKDYTEQIKNLLSRYSGISDFVKTNKMYWDVIRETRTNGKVAPSVIYNTMKKWDKYDPIVVYYSIKTHAEAHAGKKEGYTIGIMRGTSKDDAEDKLSQKHQLAIGQGKKQTSFLELDLEG